MSIKKIADILIKGIKNPKNVISHLYAILRGTYYILYYKLLRKNITIGFPLFAFAPVRIVGPGRVAIGNGCFIFKNVFRGLTIVTKSPESTVQIGERCLLGGLTVRCCQRIEIGDNTMTAASLVQDSLFVNDHSFTSPISKPVTSLSRSIVIGNNVWIGAESIVLGGCVIGADSVLSAGTVCHEFEAGGYTLISGNPAKKPLPIEKILMLKRIA